MMASRSLPADVVIRTDMRAGDLGAIVSLHGTIYAQERGWDATFEAYVAGPLAQFVLSGTPRERLWIAERVSRIVGCVAIVSQTPTVAQLRWFLVDPSARGIGLGCRLLSNAVAFSQECEYDDVVLWTERSLVAAARLYQAAGFHKVEERPGRMWGADVIEERYELRLGRRGNAGAGAT
jgi:ribosomal protein S18 acetylase RimI-like enzyme